MTNTHSQRAGEAQWARMPPRTRSLRRSRGCSRSPAQIHERRGRRLGAEDDRPRRLRGPRLPDRRPQRLPARMGRLLRRNCPRERRRSRSAAGLRLRLGELAPAAAPEVPPARAPTSYRTTPSTGRGTTGTASYRPGSRSSTARWAGTRTTSSSCHSSASTDRSSASCHSATRSAACDPTTSNSHSRSHWRHTRRSRSKRRRSGSGFQRHQSGLEQLLHVSSQLPQTMSTEAMLTSVCEAVREALDFDKVLIQLTEPEDGRLRSAASAGWPEGGTVTGGLELPRDHTAFRPRVRDRGLLSRPPRGGRAPGRQGAGGLRVRPERERAARLEPPLARRASPSTAPTKKSAACLWADEPRNRLLPNEDVLQALRVFANHAMEALAVATQLAETKFLADHDPLTRLLNRRALLASTGRKRVRSTDIRTRSSSSTSTTSRKSTTVTAMRSATACSPASARCWQS